MTKTITIYNDPDCECPNDWDGWTLYSFNTRHVNFKHPRGFGIRRDGSSIDIGFRRKLQVGTAFVLGYFEHGNCIWFLKDERPLGTEGDFRWDGVSVAGVLVWEQPVRNLGAKTYEDRADDARRFVETYTNWANGECYGYMIEPEGESCGGFFSAEDLFQDMQEHTANLNPDDVVFEGEAAWLAKYHDWQATAKR